MKPILSLCLLVAVVLASASARAAERPNVVYIMADELGYFEPAFMGGRTIQTPNLDRLAAGGLRFNNLLAGSSVCAPTGVPEKHGFDVFLGYYDQVHAHTYYPPYLVRNSEEVPLPGNNGGSAG